MNKIEWTGLYKKGWGDELVPEAYSHPAKVSFGLAEKIYSFMMDEGMIKAGDVVGDPFGGVAGFAFHAMRNGLHWVGVELEPRFVELGNQNIGLWMGKYAPHFDGWGTAVLVQGDSRSFADIVGGISGCVSSPPYANAINGQGSGIDWSKRKAGAFAEDNKSRLTAESLANAYGQTPGQLGSMPSGDLSAAISSPPYADTIETGEGPGARTKQDWDRKWGANGQSTSDASYGRSAGQVGRLDGVISSSPFEAGTPHDGGKAQFITDKRLFGDYGSTPGNTGNNTGETFWAASREIVEQTYTAIKPGGYAAWVCGDFVRKGKRVNFGQQWLDLCTAVGFEAHTWAIAWKTEYNGTQTGLFGDVEKRTDRVSFFRRLANEKNPDNAVLNEDVIIVRKP